MRKGGSDLSIIFIAQDNPANSFSIDFAEMGDEFSDPKKYKFFQCNFDDKSVGEKAGYTTVFNVRNRYSVMWISRGCRNMGTVITKQWIN
jgi:hypothetical protein